MSIREQIEQEFYNEFGVRVFIYANLLYDDLELVVDAVDNSELTPEHLEWLDNTVKDKLANWVMNL